MCAQILSPDGPIRVGPYVRNNAVYHTSYFVRDYAADRSGWVCSAHEGPGLDRDDVPTTRSGLPQTGSTRRTYRLAIGATAEYTALQGGATQAMNSIVTLVNNRGVDKTQHGIARVDRRQSVEVLLKSKLPVKSAKEWTDPRDLKWENGGVRVKVHPGDVQVVGLE